MTKTTNLVLFLAIAAILIAGPLAMDEAFAKDDKPKKDKVPKEQVPKESENKLPIIPFSQCDNDPPSGTNNGVPFLEIWDVICALQENLDNAVDDLQEQIDNLVSALATETSERETADTALQAAIDADGDTDSSNEDQTLSTTDGDVVLSTTAAGDGGGTVTCIDITGDATLCDGDDAVVDNDNDSSNELQTLSTTEGSVDLSNGGNSVSCIDITGGAGLCDGIDAVTDADSSTTNEIQTLTESSPGVIALSSGGSVTVQDRVEGECAVGSSIRVIAANGAVTCETDDSGGFPSVYVVSGSKSLGGTLSNSFTVSCDTGDRVLNWGFKAGSTSITLVQADTLGSSGIFFQFKNNGISTFTNQAEVFCLDFGIPHS